MGLIVIAVCLAVSLALGVLCGVCWAGRSVASMIGMASFLAIGAFTACLTGIAAVQHGIPALSLPAVFAAVVAFLLGVPLGKR